MKRAFVNGKFFLGGDDFARGVLVENEVFTHIGDDEHILAVCGDCEVVDLGGRVVLPGFNDSHMHLFNVGAMRQSWNILDADSISGIIASGKEYIANRAIAPGKGVFGRGWNQDYFTDEARDLTRHDLDKISREHPIIATRACGHLATANSLALEMAGIGRDTIAPEGGEIRLDADGNPTGVITENALSLLGDLYPEANIEDMVDTIKSAMEYAASHGITSVQTNDIRNNNWRMMLDAYKLVYERGFGILRTYHQCCFTDPAGLRDFIDNNKMGAGDDMHKIGPIKMFVDGSLGAHTSAMRQPFADNPETCGVYCMTSELLDEMVGMADAAGFGCVVHAIGDGGIDRVLTAYEKLVGGGNPLRHGIIHVQITDIPLLERFAAGNILALVQPIFLHYDMRIVDSRVGPALAATSYAFNTMDKLRIRASYGTDAPIEDLHTMNNLHCAINRQDLKGAPQAGYNPAERVPLARAIHNYTAESAYASFDENRKGRIAIGFLADMAILDSDIFNTPQSEIRHTKIFATILGGKTVWQNIK